MDKSKVWITDRQHSSLSHWIVAAILFLALAGVGVAAGYFLIQQRKNTLAAAARPDDSNQLEKRLTSVERKQYLSSIPPMLRFCEEQPEPVRTEYLAYYFELNKQVSRKDLTANYFLNCRFPEVYSLVHQYVQAQVPFSEQQREKFHAEFVIGALQEISKLCVEHNAAPSQLDPSVITARLKLKFSIDPAITRERQQYENEVRQIQMRAGAERARHTLGR